MLRLRSALSAGRSGVRVLSARPQPAGANLSLYVHKNQCGPILAVRHFASGGTDGFRETLDKINKKSTDSKAEESEGSTKEGAAKADSVEGDTTTEKTGEEKASSENPSVDYSNLFRKTSDFATDAYVTIKDNFNMAWADLTGASKQTTLRRSVMQAESFRRGGEASSEDAEEEQKYDGPTAMVVVKDRGSAWDRMKSRLSSSPLIREMLKNTKKVKEAAASTDIGKKAFETGQNVKDKMEVCGDLRC